MAAETLPPDIERELRQLGVVAPTAPKPAPRYDDYVAWKPTPEQKEPPF